VVNKETVPVERVRVGKEVHTDTEAVSADVAREEIEIDADGDGDTDLIDRGTDRR
jgi:stress response protein YsnF